MPTPLHCIFRPLVRSLRLRRRRNATKTSKHPPTIHCPICSTKAIPGPPLPCGERYCATCLRKQFTWALHSAPYSPARCCGLEIPLSLLHDIDGGGELLAKFAAVVPDPLNCARCTRWVLPELVGEDKAVCGQIWCGGETCAICAQEAHSPEKGEVCERSSEERCEIQFRRLVNKNGWRECATCGFVLSRDTGCAEVVCRCGNIEVLAF